MKDEHIIFLAILYAFSFFVFGWIVRGWKEEDIKNNKEKFWVIKHYWKKFISNTYQNTAKYVNKEPTLYEAANNFYTAWHRFILEFLYSLKIDKMLNWLTNLIKRFQ